MQEVKEKPAYAWDIKGMPHKGWTSIGLEDLHDTGRTKSCEMCGMENLRFVHTILHPCVHTKVEVGRICASKLTEDYKGVLKSENLARKRARRKAKWLAGPWNMSKKGNPWRYIKTLGRVGVYGNGKFWWWWIGKNFGELAYTSRLDAMRALYSELYEDERHESLESREALAKGLKDGSDE